MARVHHMLRSQGTKSRRIARTAPRLAVTLVWSVSQIACLILSNHSSSTFLESYVWFLSLFLRRHRKEQLHFSQNVSDSNCTLQHPAGATSCTLSARPYLLSPALLPAAKPAATQKNHSSGTLQEQLIYLRQSLQISPVLQPSSREDFKF